MKLSEFKTTRKHGNSDIRVLLWDIDGTLIRSRRQGAFKEYMIPFLESVFGTSGRLNDLSVSGMTDLQLIGEALNDTGVTHEHIYCQLDLIRQSYLHEMQRVTSTSKLFELLDGARNALVAAEEHPRYLNSMLTGNIESAANLKMELMGLNEFFKLRGAYGDDSHDRRDLPAIAAQRISGVLGFQLQPADLIVIGDTPNDIACARHFGAKVLAVATGRSQTPELLHSHSPDALLADLSDTDLFIRTLGAL